MPSAFPPLVAEMFQARSLPSSLIVDLRKLSLVTNAKRHLLAAKAGWVGQHMTCMHSIGALPGATCEGASHRGEHQTMRSRTLREVL